MSKKFISEARDVHLVATLQQYVLDHEHHMRRQAAQSGRPATQLLPHAGQAAAVARVDLDRWIVDCDCGNGCAVWWKESGAGVACCYECGEIHQVAPVADRSELERELVKRAPRFRQLDPGETPEDIRKQNRQHGVTGR